jgi:transposase-like protein
MDTREEFKQRLIAAVDAGELTVAEAAKACGLSRATMHRRCKLAGINPRKARAEYVSVLVAAMERLTAPFDQATH